MRTPILALTTVAVLALAGCGGGAGTGPTPVPSSPGASVSAGPSSEGSAASSDPTAGDTSSPSPGPKVSVAKCLSGNYRLARFVGVGANSTYGTGEGGDVQVAFDDGTYTMTGQGQEPIQLALAGQQAQLAVDGTVRGSYKTSGSKATFTVKHTTGTATLRAGTQQQQLSMADVATVVAPSGKATLACFATELVMTFDDVRLELER